MSGDLPWMDNLTNVDYVHTQKKGYMTDISAFMRRCFKSQDYPGWFFLKNDKEKFREIDVL